MLLEIKGMRVEPFPDKALSWDGEGEGLSKDVGKDSQEHHRDVDDLRLKVKDLLENGAENGQSDASLQLACSGVAISSSQLTEKEHAKGPWIQ